MRTERSFSYPAFKRAMIFSFSAHIVLFLLILVSPSLPGSSKKGMIYYIPLNFGGLPGGGEGGSRQGGIPGEPEKTESKRESLRDLTTVQKLQEEPKSSLRYPVEKPKREAKAKQDKKAAISRPPQKEPSDKRSEPSRGGQGTGSGLRIGVGGPGSGEGFGSGYADQIGISNFPFNYYLQIIRDKISSNWFTSLVEPGAAGNFRTTVYFKIFKNGQISNVEVKESSGTRSFDLVAVGAVMRAAPFPPLPPEYEEEHLGIILIFEQSK
jgi:TonB family protein